MDRLQLRLFGPPEVAWGGQLLKFRSRKELALLIYLAVESGPHSREALIDLLWPASDRLRGQASLRNSLLRLRQGLGQAEAYLVSDSHSIRLDSGRPIDLDLHTILTVTEAATPSSHQLEMAIDSYRGSFLAGFALADAPDFDHWVSQRRSVWQQRLDHLFEQLTRRHMEAGEIAAALERTRQWLASDPLQESAYRRLMQLHAQRGERSIALQVYEQCCRLLADELGVPPAAETVALMERIKHDKVTRWQGDKVTELVEVTLSPPHPVAPSPPHLVIPFVGRAANTTNW
jgi:DNA-binding SARP family transcriptional activator